MQIQTHDKINLSDFQLLTQLSSRFHPPDVGADEGIQVRHDTVNSFYIHVWILLTDFNVNRVWAE